MCLKPGFLSCCAEGYIPDPRVMPGMECRYHPCNDAWEAGVGSPQMPYPLGGVRMQVWEEGASGCWGTGQVYGTADWAKSRDWTDSAEQGTKQTGGARDAPGACHTSVGLSHGDWSSVMKRSSAGALQHATVMEGSRNEALHKVHGSTGTGGTPKISIRSVRR